MTDFNPKITSIDSIDPKTWFLRQKDYIRIANLYKYYRLHTQYSEFFSTTSTDSIHCPTEYGSLFCRCTLKFRISFYQDRFERIRSVRWSSLWLFESSCDQLTPKYRLWKACRRKRIRTPLVFLPRILRWILVKKRRTMWWIKWINCETVMNGCDTKKCSSCLTMFVYCVNDLLCCLYTVCFGQRMENVFVWGLWYEKYDNDTLKIWK